MKALDRAPTILSVKRCHGCLTERPIEGFGWHPTGGRLRICDRCRERTVEGDVLLLPGFERPVWEVRSRLDAAANALADRHYSRKTPGSGQVGPPGRKLVLVSPDHRALWLTHWPYASMTMDGLDAWRCSIFRNEGTALSSDLIRAAMELTARVWQDRPLDGWVTWIDTRSVDSPNPGYCFKKAGWWLDRAWSHRHLVRLRAEAA